jgi:hypothetical protein
MKAEHNRSPALLMQCFVGQTLPMGMGELAASIESFREQEA